MPADVGAAGRIHAAADLDRWAAPMRSAQGGRRTVDPPPSARALRDLDRQLAAGWTRPALARDHFPRRVSHRWLS